MKIFIAPIVASFALPLFWLYALTHHVDLGPTAHGQGGQSNAAWFNVVLIVLLIMLWISSLTIFAMSDRRKK